MAEQEHPFAGPARTEHDLDLGDGHWLDWSFYEGERCGGTITHVKGDGFCGASFTIDGTKWAEIHRGPVWRWNGEVEQPTLSPSFNCHCGQSHGYVIAGRWERA